jgi:ZIP family zinc transporter
MENLINSPVLISSFLGVLAFLNILFGGLLVIKLKKHFNTILGVSGGIMIATVAFEVLPEIFKRVYSSDVSVSTLPISTSFVIGIMLFHFLSKVLPLHEHGHHEDSHGHNHTHVHATSSVGSLGTIVMVLHSFVDGFGIGTGFSVSMTTGVAIALAVMSHNISDGINTASNLIRNKIVSFKFKVLFSLSIFAPLFGVFASFLFSLNESFLLIFLSFFSGSILYLAVSDILPYAHSNTSSKAPIIGTLAGVLSVFIVIQLL